MNRARGKTYFGWRQGISVGLLSFVLGLAFALPAQSVFININWTVSLVALISIILIGVFFDIVGVAAAAAEAAPFHAMAAANVPGSWEALWVLRHADKVASFCNDVIGDIAGTLSGALGAAIAVPLLVMAPKSAESWLISVILAAIAATTIGLKAACKSLALQQSTMIILGVGKGLHALDRLGILRLRDRKNNQAKARHSGARR